MSHDLHKKLKTIAMTGAILLEVILLAACAVRFQPPARSFTATPVILHTMEAPTPTPKALLTPTFRLPQKPTVILEAISTPKTEGDGFQHELVFAIRNAGRYSGEDGQSAWFGWGADHFAIAPDGSFWIADTPADPDRLLHYSPAGERIGTISMQIQERKYWARDLFADTSGLWVLDNITRPGLLLRLDFNGTLLASYPIPEEFASYQQEETIMPGLWNIVSASENQVLLDGPVGIVELSKQGNQPVYERLEGYPIEESFYVETEKGFAIDGKQVPVDFLQPEHFINHIELVGASGAGSVYIQISESNVDQGKPEPPDSFVRRYDPSGNLSGIALLPLSEVHEQPDVALGPDGSVYAMYSYTDHSVEFYRLLFYTGPAPLLSPFRMLPKTYFGPLLPSGITPATDLDAAREVMLTFFLDLAYRKYDEAAALYGGTFTDAIALNVVTNSDSPGMAWQNICDSMFCLPVSDILDSRQLAPDTYEFLVGFGHENGFRFDYGPCCGYFQPMPSSAWFVYSVIVHKTGGQWKVMAGPEPFP